MGERSGGEGPDVLDWHRRFCKAQRGRLVHRFAQAEKRVREARVDAMEDWDAGKSRTAKKPSLDYYDARWR